MKLSFNATTLRNFDLPRALGLIREAGYDGVEIALNDQHLHPLKSSAAQVTDIRDLCASIGLPVVCVAAGGPTLLGSVPYEPSLICEDSAGRQARLEVIRRSIDLAQRLDCPVVNINSGLPTARVSPRVAQEYLMAALERLLPDLGSTILVLEPEPDFFVGTTTKAIQVIEAVGSPQLRLNLDIGHVFCSEEDCYTAIRRALPYTRHIHIEDIKDGIHHHEIPGEGDIDFHQILQLLAQAEYSHYASVELHHHDQMWQRALDESRRYLLLLAQQSSKAS